jgi:aspartyl-tRNA(Asn)/glutamyl-tRNA(Gln) amidotransferase subunit B
MPKTVSNWITGELFRLLNLSGVEMAAVKVTPAQLAALLKMVDAGKINISTGKSVLEEMFGSGRGAQEITAEGDLAQISDVDELGSTVDRVLKDNPEAISDYRVGKTQALRFLVGQVMKATRGKANPQMVNSMLADRLAEKGEG